VLIDIYVLTLERSAAIIARFLAHFMPDRERADSDYTVRVGGDKPTKVFDTPEEMATFCESQTGADGRAYWRNRHLDDPHSAHVFFLPDGWLVLGLSVAVRDVSVWDMWLDKLRTFVGAAYGYWTCECPPEDTVAEFVATAKNASLTRSCT
jgi:hypothetical protein